MAVKVGLYLDNVEQEDRLIELAMRLGYYRWIRNVKVANLSAFLRAIADGKLRVTAAGSSSGKGA